MSLFGSAAALLRGEGANSSGGADGFTGRLRSTVASLATWVRNGINSKQTRVFTAKVTKFGISWGQWSYSTMRTVGWFLVTSAMITAVPLIFEYNRELQLEELEKLQIAKGLAEGGTPYGLAQQGLSGAVEPKVLR